MLSGVNDTPVSVPSPLLSKLPEVGKTSYSARVRELVRKNPGFFLFAVLAAIALRLLFILRVPAVTADSFVYGDIAKNWLDHGIYGLSGLTKVSHDSVAKNQWPSTCAP